MNLHDELLEAKVDWYPFVCWYCNQQIMKEESIEVVGASCRDPLIIGWECVPDLVHQIQDKMAETWND